jgi:hypothetical protein
MSFAAVLPLALATPSHFSREEILPSFRSSVVFASVLSEMIQFSLIMKELPSWASCAMNPG